MMVTLLDVAEKWSKGTVYVADVSGNSDTTGISTPAPEPKISSTVGGGFLNMSVVQRGFSPSGPVKGGWYSRSVNNKFSG
jgi:hypothetical protein